MLRINTSGAALSGGCGCVWVTDVLFPQRSLFHAERHGSAVAGARQPHGSCALLEWLQGLVPPLLSCPATAACSGASELACSTKEHPSQ